ncbi:UNVERIFIED_CONTAM: Wall-associated receptor kinase [Sesamum latifolium]|uniref:Wall-associated receptor kinase n=1 Tax=Sesamum latifolium TaxID=2727402 RepID=A0AAW2WXK9_9LAMI
MAPDHRFLLAFLIICRASTFLQAAEIKSEASIVMASGDCRRKCGDIEVPYPFGMSKGCYLDETFRVICNESTGSASLALLGWEVESINISMHTLRHRNFRGITLPFNRSGGPYVSSFPPVAGQHYSISKAMNQFVAMGCDFLAYLIDEDTGKVQGSCSSLCNPNDTVPVQLSSCSGLFCCEISFPETLKNLSVWVQRMDYMRKQWENQCGFFTFVEKDFLSFNNMKFSTCNESYVVPMIHEWAVGNTGCIKAKESIDEYVCGQNTRCTDYYPAQGYRCECNNGYRGNPYLPQGCQDVDECSSPEDNNCPVKTRCVNTEGSYFCLPNRGRMLGLLIPLGVGLGVGLLILVAVGIWTWRKLKQIKERNMKKQFFRRNGGLLLQQQIFSTRGSALLELTLFKIEELEKATDNFSGSRVLGKGGHGTVYKGMLSDGRIVAVKKANVIDNSEQVGQFINEVSILSQINHRHIVKLLGCCLETEVPLLVYEHISNGTLSHHLHDEPNSSSFSWENRLRIAAEVAGALAYMHSYASTAIFHRDVKSSNILLDENYKAVVSDFGLSRSVPIDKTHLTTLVGGTFGYLDPEYFRSGKLNDKSDVYAFGVVLAEILTGQKAVSIGDDHGLAFRFRSAVKDNSLFDILDKVVVSEGKEEEILALAKLAKRCLKINAHKRLNMKEVAAELDQLRKTKEVPGHQESLWREYRSVSENWHRFNIGSEAEDHLLLPISF